MQSGASGFGDEFVPRLNEAAVMRGGHQFRPIQTLVVRPTEGIGQIAADHIRKGRLRAGPAVTKRLLKLLDMGVADDADLASYLLFDGGFSRRLVDLGRSDAHARRTEILDFLANLEDQGPPASEPQEGGGSGHWTLPPPAIG
jgi:NTE family protein